MLTDSKKTRDANNLHHELKHLTEDINWVMGKSLSLKITGTSQVCKACTLGKAKRLGKQVSCNAFKNRKVVACFLY